MRHTQRITTELRLLVAVHGADAVVWAPDYSWVTVEGFPLPPGLTVRATNLLVMIPDGYGHGVPYKELYVDPALRVWHAGAWREIPHYFDEARRYAPTPTVRSRNWRYLCLHMDGWRPADNILTFLKQVELFLSDPFNPRWEAKR
ncbi:MAG: hypothetical protein HYV93_05055 [Candidatus Rokubacteria bacterium]|nr:hypothetical protein [Candidatus Rokubacteria bacterium]